MANPPFNVNSISKDKIKDDNRHYPFGIPRADNGNYLWIQLFYSALNKTGRAGFVMANSASDARQSEQVIREQLIKEDVVDVMVSIGPNFFYNVTLPVTLWFLDRVKAEDAKGKTLFLDARGIYNQIDRAHREFTPEQVSLLASIARLYRGEGLNGFVFQRGNYTLPDPQLDALEAMFTAGEYVDIAGLCKVASIEEIESQSWSLNPGRYVGVAERAQDDIDFKVRLEELNEELEVLNGEAHGLEEKISENINILLSEDILDVN